MSRAGAPSKLQNHTVLRITPTPTIARPGKVSLAAQFSLQPVKYLASPAVEANR